MKKSQISFEFIVLFTIALFIFAVFASFIPKWIDKTASTKKIAENLAKEIKVKVITASLAKSDFKSEINIPDKINDIEIDVEICGKPNYILNIKDSNGLLAKVFLPKITDHVGSCDISGPKLIVKRESNNLNIII